MVPDEKSRTELLRRLSDTLGPQAADTLMSYLPATPWADVATKQDLRALEERMERKFASKEDLRALEDRMEIRLTSTKNEVMANVRGDILNQTRSMIFAMVATNFTAVSLAFAAARFA